MSVTLMSVLQSTSTCTQTIITRTHILSLSHILIIDECPTYMHMHTNHNCAFTYFCTYFCTYICARKPLLLVQTQFHKSVRHIFSVRWVSYIYVHKSLWDIQIYFPRQASPHICRSYFHINEDPMVCDAQCACKPLFDGPILIQHIYCRCDLLACLNIVEEHRPDKLKFIQRRQLFD